MKRITSLVISLFLLIALFSCGIKGKEVSFESTVEIIDKYGNITLSSKATEFLSSGFEYADIVNVNINGNDYEMPAGSNYGDVDEGKMILRLDIEEETDTDRMVLAVNMGNFAQTAQIATKSAQEADPGYVWEYNPGVTTPVSVKITLKEAGGYLEEYTVRALVRTNERSDYAPMTDAEFANFRMINTKGTGEGKIYRSSSPINPELGRSVYADKELEKAGVKTVMNLADNEESMHSYGTWEDSYYSTCNVIPLNLGVDIYSAEFKAGIAKGFRFFIENDGPYLIHCTEGKDRAGFTSAVIECLMGAGAEEVVEDYMVTYYNYYDVEKNTASYDTISKIISDSLAKSFGIGDIFDESVDLAAEAYDYFTDDLGLTEDEVDTLIQKLS